MITSYYPYSEKKISEIDRSGCLYNSGTVEIEGVVSPESQSGFPLNRSAVHIFSLEAWRIDADKAIINKKLLILRPVAASTNYLKDIGPYAILKLSVYLNLNNTRAIFERGEIVANSESSVFEAIAIELAKPILMETDLFGTLTLDKSWDWFVGKAGWNGHQIEVYFPIYEIIDIAKGLETAGLIWEEKEKWNDKMESYIVENLLNLKNESWLQNGEKEITAKEFENLIQLKSIFFNFDGSFEFWYDDGDLFWGHSIQVTGNIVDGLTFAGIAG